MRKLHVSRAISHNWRRKVEGFFKEKIELQLFERKLRNFKECFLECLHAVIVHVLVGIIHQKIFVLQKWVVKSEV